MDDKVEDMEKFVSYVKLLKGDEKSEAQVFCDRLFQAFGHAGYKEAGAELEHRIKKYSTKGTSFADLIWKPRLLLEMKKRGENLYQHFPQAVDYWINAVPNRPRYVALCNFDEFWIYDFDKQIDQPVDKISIETLPKQYTALNFLFPDNPKPEFGNDMEAVSKEAADKVASVFKSLTDRGVERTDAQLFALQILVAMFSESVGLLPKSIIRNLVEICFQNKVVNSYDLFGLLFKHMNSEEYVSGGGFKNVPYFNGGIFQKIRPLELNMHELELIGGEGGAATKDWSKVNPSIFGAIFQQSMEAGERHTYGAHYTSEADILSVITPTIIRPWRERINGATSMKALLSLRKEMLDFKVLDPACGCGNFLYLSYREMVRLEISLMKKLKQIVSQKNFLEQAKALTLVSPKQFFGIDQDSFGVELSKVTLMLAKKLASDETIDAFEQAQLEMPLQEDHTLPLDNLDGNFKCDDALFTEWPEVDAIVGNPPFQSKNKITREFGRSYVNNVRKKFSDVSGRADYCVYWFRKAHDHLKFEQRAGLVGTNTIKQNYSREGGLDYIVNNSGTITEAVSNQVWSGDANVHVSIVNWIKGEQVGKKKISRQNGNSRESDWEKKFVDTIGPSLSFDTDVSTARPIKFNSIPKICHQGQTHGHEKFLLEYDAALEMLGKHPETSKYLHPYLISSDIFGAVEGLPSRFVIDFGGADLFTAQKYTPLFKPLEKFVLPFRESKAQLEVIENEKAKGSDSRGKVGKHHSQALENWWNLIWRREELISKIESMGRYLVCARVSSRAIFEFVSPVIHPNDLLTVFVLDDDYSFGILQSSVHCKWFAARCSTLASAPRYTSNTVFNSFPWPQKPTKSSIRKVAKASAEFRNLRQSLKNEHQMSLRDIHKTIEMPGRSKLKDAQEYLDKTVKEAYEMKKSDDPLEFLLQLNHLVTIEEERGNSVIGPGLPPIVGNRSEFITKDCVQMPIEVLKLLKQDK